MSSLLFRLVHRLRSRSTDLAKQELLVANVNLLQDIFRPIAECKHAEEVF